MSTNKLQIPKYSESILLFSGIYLFFITLVTAPFVNFPSFSTFHTTTKLFLVTSAGILGLLQLLIYVPKITHSFIKSIPTIVIQLIKASILLLFISIILSTSPKTAVFGMFTAWESNLMIYTVYAALLLAWYIHFLIAKQLKVHTLIFNILLTLLLITTITFGLGEYYVWEPNTGYISLTVIRLSLGFRNPLFAGYFAGMLWSFQFIRTLLILMQKRSQQNLILLIGHLLLTAGITHILMLTYTRSAWISSILSISIIIPFYLYTLWKKKKFAIRRFMVGIITIAMVISPQLYILKDSIKQRNSDLIVESPNTLSTIANSIGAKQHPEKALSFYQDTNKFTSADIRILEWKWGLRTWTGNIHNFLFGVGADNIYFEMPRYRDPIFNSIPTDSSIKPFYIRNVFITTLVEHGLLFTLTYFTLLIILFKNVLTTFISGSTSNKQLETLILPLTIILTWVTQGIFYYSTHITTVLLLYPISFMFAQMTDFTKISLRHATKSERTILFLLIVTLSTWLGLIVKTEIILAIYKVSPLPNEAIVMEKNATLPLNNKVLQRYLAYYYPSRISSQKYLSTMINSYDPDDLRIAGDAYYLLARRQNDLVSLNNSITAIDNLIAIDDSLPAIWDARGLRYLFKGDFETANNSFYKALELKNDYWYAYMHLGETARQQCNPQKAIEFYKKAELFIPSAEGEINTAKQEIIKPRKECIKD